VGQLYAEINKKSYQINKSKKVLTVYGLPITLRLSTTVDDHKQREQMNISYELLQELADRVDGTPYPNYSGRGMYGTTCAGIVLESINLLELGVAIGELSEDFEDSTLKHLLLTGHSTDSMGLREIVYWESVVCEDAPDEEEEED